MKIRMHLTINGSVDGIRVELYEAGKTYDLDYCDGARDLAKAFVGANMAGEVKDEAPTMAPVAAAVEVADEPAPVMPPKPAIAQPTPEHRGRKPKK